MEPGKPQPTNLKDYQKPIYTINSCELVFELDCSKTIIRSNLQIEFNGDNFNHQEMVLDCKDINIDAIWIDNIEVGSDAWIWKADKLHIFNPPGRRFLFQSLHHINPMNNRALEGLYISSGNFCTQNEAEGFRRITPFIDRPDVMSTYTVTIIADKQRYPVLLCNGNRTLAEDLDDGKHKVIWHDPHPKPCYLFALVAGDFGYISDSFQTKSARCVTLEIYTDKGNEHLCEFAMSCLKKAMKWDEDVFGLEYDLDLYMIVAVEDFNMGAMENKGLNIFNSKLVLADKTTATDELFESIEAVIAHEYFHNWTGNRITCRDWFQLTLKEGLTVYRDQRFTADMTNRSVKRIKDVKHLRQFQFPEDAGPLSHPIQPDQYIEINNFYTQTIYEKGAEVIRMIATLIGEDAFVLGIAEYFRLYDGQAVTIDEFLNAMSNVSDLDIKGFRKWYKTAKTPVLIVNKKYDAPSKTLVLDFGQKIPGKPDSPALMIPVRTGFCSREKTNSNIKCSNDQVRRIENDFLLVLSNKTDSFTFTGVNSGDVCSILRDFSAPVNLEYRLNPEELTTQIMHDSDGFIRWNSIQDLYFQAIDENIILLKSDDEVSIKAPQFLIQTIKTLIQNLDDPMLLSWLLTFPSMSEILSRQKLADFENTHLVLKGLKCSIAKELESYIHSSFLRACQKSEKKKDDIIGWRRLKNVLLSYLTSLEIERYLVLCLDQQRSAQNLTDELASFKYLCEARNHFRKDSISMFHKKWNQNSLVMDYYFNVLASCSHPETPGLVRSLEADPAFRFDNPNKIRSLYGSFGRNALLFNKADGQGYEIIANVIKRLDPVNPAMAAGLCRVFTRTANLDASRKKMVKKQLNKILSSNKVSVDLFEISRSCLKAI